MHYTHTCRQCGALTTFNYTVHDDIVDEVEGNEQCYQCNSQFNMTDIQSYCFDDHYDNLQEQINRRYEHE